MKGKLLSTIRIIDVMLKNQYLNLNEVGLNGVNSSWIAVYANQFNILLSIDQESKDREMPIDMMARNKEGINPLHLACYYDNFDIVRFFTDPEVSMDLNQGTLAGYSPLIIALIR